MNAAIKIGKAIGNTMLLALELYGIGFFLGAGIRASNDVINQIGESMSRPRKAPAQKKPAMSGKKANVIGFVAPECKETV